MTRKNRNEAVPDRAAPIAMCSRIHYILFRRRSGDRLLVGGGLIMIGRRWAPSPHLKEREKDYSRKDCECLLPGSHESTPLSRHQATPWPLQLMPLYFCSSAMTSRRA